MSRTFEICGNCSSYERFNAWSGICAVARVTSSPGVPCPIGKFTPHACTPKQYPVGSFPTASLVTDCNFRKFDFQTKSWSDLKVSRLTVEVMATVGPWSMVRHPPPESKSNFEDVASFSREEPFVVETIQLEWNTPSSACKPS